MGMTLNQLNTLAGGAMKGWEQADVSRARAEESARSERRTAIMESGEERAARLGAIQEEGASMQLARQKREEQWQQEENQAYQSFREEKDKDGNVIPWTPERAEQYGQARFARDLARADRVKPDDLVKMADYHAKMNEKGVYESFKKLQGGDMEGGKKFLDQFDLASGHVGKNKQGDYVLAGVTNKKKDKDGNEIGGETVEIPLEFVGISTSKELGDAIQKMKASKAAEARVQFYTGAAQDAKLGTLRESQMKNLYEPMYRPVQREIDTLTRQLGAEGLDAKRRSELETQLSAAKEKSDNILNERNFVSGIMDAAHGENIRMSAGQAQSALRDAWAGRNIEERGDGWYYKLPGGKSFLLPNQTVPNDVRDRLRKPQQSGGGGGAAQQQPVQRGPDGRLPGDRIIGEPAQSQRPAATPGQRTAAVEDAYASGKWQPTASRQRAMDLEDKDKQLGALGFMLQSKDPNIATDAWVKYVKRVKELQGG